LCGVRACLTWSYFVLLTLCTSAHRPRTASNDVAVFAVHHRATLAATDKGQGREDEEAYPGLVGAEEIGTISQYRTRKRGHQDHKTGLRQALCGSRHGRGPLSPCNWKKAKESTGGKSTSLRWQSCAADVLHADKVLILRWKWSLSVQGKSISGPRHLYRVRSTVSIRSPTTLPSFVLGLYRWRTVHLVCCYSSTYEVQGPVLFRTGTGPPLET
jgi:hypothetical protein